MIRRGAVLFLMTVFCFAQEEWKTAPTVPGVDLSGLSPAARTVVLDLLRSEGCPCGCDLKIAECRTKDPKCAVSHRLSDLVLKEISSGKSSDTVRAQLRKMAAEGPPLLEAPVKLSIDGDPMKGPANAKVTVVEFSDFQCPYCAKAVAEANKVLEAFPNEVRLVFKQFPLDFHSQAALAAEASLAAQAQGKFWEMHDKMYANFRQISRDHILIWAKDLGLDINRFQSELDSHKYAKRVAAELQEGEKAGVAGTPTFYIEGKRLNANFDVKTATPLILQELKR